MQEKFHLSTDLNRFPEKNFTPRHSNYRNRKRISRPPILFRLKSRRFIGCCAHSATIFVITFSPQRAALLRYNSIAIPLLLNATIYNVRFRVAFMCPHVTPMRTIYPEFHESSPRRGRRSNRAPHLSSAYVPVYSYRLKPSRVTWANTCYNNAIKEKNKREREREIHVYIMPHTSMASMALTARWFIEIH